MAEPHKPGQPCRIVNSQFQVNGLGQGPNFGKEVTTIFLHDTLAGDTDPVWRVAGKDLVSGFGGVGTEVDCLQSWLQVIEPEPPKVITTVKEKELTQ